MRRCDTHQHGSYVTFRNAEVYHLANERHEATLCDRSIGHPYQKSFSGEVITRYPSGTPFPDFHQQPPQDLPLCLRCAAKTHYTRCFQCDKPITEETYRAIRGHAQTLYFHPLCAQIMHDGLMKDVEEIERMYPETPHEPIEKREDR